MAKERVLMTPPTEAPGCPGGSDSKEAACQCRRHGFHPWDGRSPGGGHGNLLQNCCLGQSHEQRSPAGCSPWACKESDKMNE